MCIKKCIFSLVCIVSSCFGSENIPESRVDAVVLGGGVGGLTSAVYLSRSGLKTIVLEGGTPGGAIIQSHGIQNWPGELEISGLDLIEKMKGQAEKNGAIVCAEEAVEVDFSKAPFSFIVQDPYDSNQKRKIIADVCIIATGSKARNLDVPGEKKYWSKGVYTCAVCDGALYKDQIVSVVGGGDAAVLEADYLSGLAKKVYVFVRGKELKGVEIERRKALLQKENVEIVYNVQVKEIQGSEQRVEKVLLSRGGKEVQKVPVDAVFLAVGSIPNTALFGSQVKLTPNGYIALQDQCETSVPGVFAVGDVVDYRFRQAISAAGDGAKAAIQAQQFFSSARQKKISIAIESEGSALQKANKIIEIKSVGQLQQVIRESKIPLILDFYATWCPPCRHVGGFVEGWAKDLEGKVLFCKVDVDVAQDVAYRYNIRSMPTFVKLDAEGKEETRKLGSGEIIKYIRSLQ